MMDEEFDGTSEDNNQIQNSILRYEEMLRKHDEYFFDVDAFLNIIDYYIDKNDPVKSLQVVEFAQQQHSYSVEFLLRKAQLLAMVEKYNEALMILEDAEKITPTDPDIPRDRTATAVRRAHLYAA